MKMYKILYIKFVLCMFNVYLSRYDYKVVQEMLSTAACIQGQSIMQTSAGKPHLRKAALNVFELSAW